MGIVIEIYACILPRLCSIDFRSDAHAARCVYRYKYLYFDEVYVCIVTGYTSVFYRDSAPFLLRPTPLQHALSIDEYVRTITKVYMIIVIDYIFVCHRDFAPLLSDPTQLRHVRAP